MVIQKLKKLLEKNMMRKNMLLYQIKKKQIDYYHLKMPLILRKFYF